MCTPQTDLTFDLRGIEQVSVHKFMLAARSAYFGQQFATRWRDRRTVKISNKLVGLLNAPVTFQGKPRYPAQSGRQS